MLVHFLCNFFWALSKCLIGCCPLQFFKWLQCLLSLLCFSSHLGLWLLHNQQDTGYWEPEQFKLAGIKEWRRKKKEWSGTAFLLRGSTYSTAHKVQISNILFWPCYHQLKKCFHHCSLNFVICLFSLGGDIWVPQTEYFVLPEKTHQCATLILFVYQLWWRPSLKLTVFIMWESRVLLT